MNVIKRNLGWLLLSQAATWGCSIALLLIAPRKLGDNAFGQLSFALVYVSFFELVALFGSGTYLMKEIARDTTSLARYVVNTLILKVPLTLALIVIAIGLAIALGYSSDMVLLIGAYCLGMFFNSLNNALAGGLQGIEHMGRPALWDVARAYVGTAFGLIVLYNGGSLLAYALAFNIACAIPLIGNAFYIRPWLRTRTPIDVRLWGRILAGGTPFFIWSALLVVYGTIDIPLLERFSGNDAVGWYALAWRWVSMPAFFAASVSVAFFPALSAQRVHVPESFARTANRALHLVVFVATPAAFGIAVIADTFISTLYGGQFQEAVPLMRILALHIPIVGMDIVLGSVLVTADRQRQWVMVGVIAAIFNPLINLAAIPLTDSWFGNGAIGAAIITVMTELIMMTGAIRLRPAGVLDAPTRNLLLRIVLAGAAMIPVVLVLRPTPLPVQILAGAATYGLVSLALGTISIREIRTMGVGMIGRGRRSTVAP
ncbi:MAG TPA: flippase [Acidimicrobiales bacterium]|jgi:O-antigen/teichoic acid export membrane protein